MSSAAFQVLCEMFVRGDRVRSRDGLESVVWTSPLTELVPSLSRTTSNRAKNELLDRGLLIEHPGMRLVNGRRLSAWSVPVAMDVIDLSSRLGLFKEPPPSAVSYQLSATGEQCPSCGTCSGGCADSAASEAEFGTIHKEGGACSTVWSELESEEAVRPSRVRARPVSSSSSAIGGVAVVTKHVPGSGVRFQVSGVRQGESFSPHGRGEGGGVEGKASGVRDSTEVPVAARAEVALEGLQAAKVRHPEVELARYGVEPALSALREWVEAEMAHEADPRRHPAVRSPGGLVLTLLRDSLVGRVLPPVEDLGFSRWWSPVGTPEKVVEFARRRGLGVRR